MSDTVREFQELDEESASIVIQPLDIGCWAVLCGNCKHPLWGFFEPILRNVLNDPGVPQEEKSDFAVEVTGPANPERKVAVLLSFLNKRRGHGDFLKCPDCQKTLYCDP